MHLPLPILWIDLRLTALLYYVVLVRKLSLTKPLGHKRFITHQQVHWFSCSTKCRIHSDLINLYQKLYLI